MQDTEIDWDRDDNPEELLELAEVRMRNRAVEVLHAMDKT